MANTKNTSDKADIIGMSLKLNDLVAYQPGSIVSRVILKKDTGNITLFAFDQGQGLSEHTAPFDAHIFIAEGEAEITIAGNKSTVKSGEMIILPANKPHAVHAVTKFKMVLTMIRSN